jgi:methionine aminotransferase
MKFTGEIKPKRKNGGTTIFTVMSALANECGAINLSQGFPDFEVAPQLIRTVSENMEKGHNQYAPMAGSPSLLEAISDKVNDTYSVRYDPDTEITVTAGATQAIYTAITSMVREGDEVIVFDPAYDCYVPAIEYNNGVPVHVRLEGPHFCVDWDAVRKVVNRKTRMIILNTPHNPTGTILTAEDMVKLQDLVSGTDIIILSDEVYEHIVFDGMQHESVIRYPELSMRSFVVFSFGKTFHATGWKVGYVLAPQNMMKLFRDVHQYLVFSVNTPVQYGLEAHLRTPGSYQGIEGLYQSKRDLFSGLLKDTGFRILPCQGTYFQTVDYSGISKDKDTVFAEWLTREHGVASIPLSVFYKDPGGANYLRFCFAKKDETLINAAEKLNRI